jgi:hypothetical protein
VTKKLIQAALKWVGAMSLLLGLVPALAQPNTGEEVLKEVRLAAEKFERRAELPSWVDAVKAIPESTNNAPVVLRLADTQFLAADR